MTPLFLKNTNQESIIKLTGTDDTCSFALEDLTCNTQETVGSSQVVNIVAVNWVGEPGSQIVISRGGVIVLSLTGDQPQMFNFQGQGFVDSTRNIFNFSIQIIGTASLYLTLRKESGWATKIETATFSIYDDVTQAGS